MLCMCGSMFFRGTADHWEVFWRSAFGFYLLYFAMFCGQAAEYVMRESLGTKATLIHIAQAFAKSILYYFAFAAWLLLVDAD